jgi:hypothetical protein
MQREQQEMDTSPAKIYASQHIVNKNEMLISDSQKWKFTDLNPSTPAFKGLIKLHKPDAPINPVIIWRNAPKCNAEKFLTRTLQSYIAVRISFNIKNIYILSGGLKEIPVDKNIGLASLEIMVLFIG